MNANPIETYFLKTEHNFRIAVAVGEQWPVTRERLVSGFLDRLDLGLKKKLKGWASYRYQTFFIDAYPGYCIFKPSWEDQYSITLQLNDYGAQMVFGIVREVHNIGKRPFCEELLSAVAKSYTSASNQRWWEARMIMRSPATDWRKPEVLWRMHKNADFLQEVSEQLLDVARISEPIIDRLVRKYRR